MKKRVPLGLNGLKIVSSISVSGYARTHLSRFDASREHICLGFALPENRFVSVLRFPRQSWSRNFSVSRPKQI